MNSLSPTEALKLSLELSDRQRVSPEQVSANRQQNVRDLLSIIPGPGNYIAAEDAVTGTRNALNSAGEGRYGRAALEGGMALLSGIGAVTGLPTGRLAGNAARDAGRTLNIFAGPMAKTADHAALARAQEMAAAGVGRDVIHAQTGWHQGVDGKWRFEIDDSGAALSGITKGKGTSDFTSLDHPEFAAAYGDVPNIYGKYGPRLELSGAYLGGPSGAMPYVRAEGPSAASAREASLHELQHHAQHLEDFAGGANISTHGHEAYGRSAGEVEARNVQARMNMTAAERRAKAPWLTQDVPDERQIVRSR